MRKLIVYFLVFISSTSLYARHNYPAQPPYSYGTDARYTYYTPIIKKTYNVFTAKDNCLLYGRINDFGLDRDSSFDIWARYNAEAPTAYKGYRNEFAASLSIGRLEDTLDRIDRCRQGNCSVTLEAESLTNIKIPEIERFDTTTAMIYAATGELREIYNDAPNVKFLIHVTVKGYVLIIDGVYVSSLDGDDVLINCLK